jgi:hypothetical protein
MPAIADLPSTLQALPSLNAVRLRSDPDFPGDMDHIIEELVSFGVPKIPPVGPDPASASTTHISSTGPDAIIIGTSNALLSIKK